MVKLGGRAQSDPGLPPLLARAWRERGGALCIVHGGGNEISALQQRLGREATFHTGRRVTTDEDLDVVRMVLSGTVNKRLVAALTSAGASAVGISGEDGALIGADVVADGALGRVGMPATVNPAIVRALIDGGWLPVVSPVARDSATGKGLNVNGDDAAAALAAALGADELLLLADVKGVMSDGSVLPMVDTETAKTLIREGIAAGGMIAKLEAACAALARGVSAVRIGDLSAITDPEAGTVVVPAPLTSLAR